VARLEIAQADLLVEQRHAREGHIQQQRKVFEEADHRDVAELDKALARAEAIEARRHARAEAAIGGASATSGGPFWPLSAGADSALAT
jgi:hypothetical protein